MSNKTIMGLTLAAATVAFAVAPLSSFAHEVKCYGVKGAKEGEVKMMKSAKKCKKAGGTTKKSSDAMKTTTTSTTVEKTAE